MAAALVLLVTVTLLGLAAIRGTSMQEQLAGNSFDRERAFQAAESALRIAEDRVRDEADAMSFDVEGSDCTLPDVDCPDDPTRDTRLADHWTTVPRGSGPRQFPAQSDEVRPQYLVQKVHCPSGSGRATADGRDTSRDQDRSVFHQFSANGQCYRATARGLDPSRSENAARAKVVVQSELRR
nr:PilX N-terminal domain-containing pilus assembly protein [Guyparkeria hydrothermalis]